MKSKARRMSGPTSPKRARVLSAAPRCTLGESPRWSEEGWWWVDVEVGDIWNLASPSPTHQESAKQVFALGRRVSYVQPLQESGLLVADGADIVELGPQLTGARKRGSVPVSAGEVLNDGALNEDGTLVIGSVGPRRRADGWLWSVGARGRVSRIAGPFSMSNGMAWSSSDLLLHADSGTRKIWAHTFRAGSIHRSEQFAEFDEDEGMPDGICGDGFGGIWVAMYGAGVVQHFDSGGTRQGTIEVGTAQVTSVARGGDDGGALLITTAREGIPSGSALDPLAGRLFHADLD
ncbi:SMP-30/gluconolactonase/LRE family protein [Microbacterium sp. NPDC087592]|uniref:SMP-30/gluconolactonase/LRE family protein n=1 Tax=Microbacterium sp. NPDC087592 TaxID=3364193 RepID=UPI003802F67F